MTTSQAQTRTPWSTAKHHPTRFAHHKAHASVLRRALGARRHSRYRCQREAGGLGSLAFAIAERDLPVDSSLPANVSKVPPGLGLVRPSVQMDVRYTDSVTV